MSASTNLAIWRSTHHSIRSASCLLLDEGADPEPTRQENRSTSFGISTILAEFRNGANGRVALPVSCANDDHIESLGFFRCFENAFLNTSQYPVYKLLLDEGADPGPQDRKTGRHRLGYDSGRVRNGRTGESHCQSLPQTTTVLSLFRCFENAFLRFCY